MEKPLEDMHILVVDDHPHISAIIKSLLHSFGVGHVSSARDGEEAFKAFCTENHDMIFTDLMMEPISGIDLAKLVV